MNQISLKLTGRNNPYIEIPELGHISFVDWSKTKDGYKHLNFSFRKSNTSFLVGMDFKLKNEHKRIIKTIGLHKTIKLIEEIITKLTNKEKVFPFSNINKLGPIINKLEFKTIEKIDPVKSRRDAKRKEKKEKETNTEPVTSVKRKGNIKTKIKKVKKTKKRVRK